MPDHYQRLQEEHRISQLRQRHVTGEALCNAELDEIFAYINRLEEQLHQQKQRCNLLQTQLYDAERELIQYIGVDED